MTVHGFELRVVAGGRVDLGVTFGLLPALLVAQGFGDG